MARAETENRITGVPIAASGFQVLQTYERVSGKQLNTAKTSIFFSAKTLELNFKVLSEIQWG